MDCNGSCQVIVKVTIISGVMHSTFCTIVRLATGSTGLPAWTGAFGVIATFFSRSLSTLSALAHYVDQPDHEVFELVTDCAVLDILVQNRRSIRRRHWLFGQRRC